MTDRSDALVQAYSRALRDYAGGAGEAALLRAYQVGRDAITAGFGVLDLSAFHQRALVEALGGLAPEEHARVARAAAEVFAEALAAFEMSQRGLRGRLEEHERIERLMTEFVSIVSHELRTPLTSIHGSLDLVVKGACGALPPPAQRFLEIAHRNTRRLVALVNQMLDLQKIEAGAVEFELRPVPIGPLLVEALEDNRAYAAGFGVLIALEGEPPEVAVRADPERLLQVLTNLLCNAARFSPAGETVAVGTSRARGWVKVAVRDRGPGIPNEFRPRVFQKFAQAEASSGAREGSGLGLSISKSIVERLGGRIGFETQLGRGSTFHFELPEWRQGAGTARDGSEG